MTYRNCLGKLCNWFWFSLLSSLCRFFFSGEIVKIYVKLLTFVKSVLVATQHKLVNQISKPVALSMLAKILCTKSFAVSTQPRKGVSFLMCHQKRRASTPFLFSQQVYQSRILTKKLFFAHKAFCTTVFFFSYFKSEAHNQVVVSAVGCLWKLCNLPPAC